MNNGAGDAGMGRSGWRWRGCLVAMLTGSMAMGAAGAADARDDNFGKMKKGHRPPAPYYIVAPPARSYSPPVVYVPLPPPKRYYSAPVVYAPPPPAQNYSPPPVVAPSQPPAVESSAPPAQDPTPTIIYPTYSTQDPLAGIIRM